MKMKVTGQGYAKIKMWEEDKNEFKWCKRVKKDEDEKGS